MVVQKEKMNEMQEGYFQNRRKTAKTHKQLFSAAYRALNFLIPFHATHEVKSTLDHGVVVRIQFCFYLDRGRSRHTDLNIVSNISY